MRIPEGSIQRCVIIPAGIIFRPYNVEIRLHLTVVSRIQVVSSNFEVTFGKISIIPLSSIRKRTICLTSWCCIRWFITGSAQSVYGVLGIAVASARIPVWALGALRETIRGTSKLGGIASQCAIGWGPDDSMFVESTEHAHVSETLEL